MTLNMRSLPVSNMVLVSDVGLGSKACFIVSTFLRHSPTGCTAKFSVTSTGGSLRILKYAMLHNHPPEPVTEDFRQSLMSNETLSDQTLIAVASGIDGN